MTIELRKKSNGLDSFRAYLRIKGFKRKSATFDNEQDARKWLELMQRKVKNSKYFSTELTLENPSEKIVVCLSSELSRKLKNIVPRGKRSDYIISLIEKDLSISSFEEPKTLNPNYDFVSINKLCEMFPTFTVGGIRHLIFYAKESNFERCIKRVGRTKKRILIDVKKFQKWIINN